MVTYITGTKSSVPGIYLPNLGIWSAGTKGPVFWCQIMGETRYIDICNVWCPDINTGASSGTVDESRIFDRWKRASCILPRKKQRLHQMVCIVDANVKQNALIILISWQVLWFSANSAMGFVINTGAKTNVEGEREREHEMGDVHILYRITFGWTQMDKMENGRDLSRWFTWYFYRNIRICDIVLVLVIGDYQCVYGMC